MKQFDESEIEDKVCELITGACGNYFRVVRAVPYGMAIGPDEVKEWTPSTPFAFVAVGAEDFAMKDQLGAVYSVQPAIVIIMGTSYTTSDTAYRSLRDMARRVRHAVSGYRWTLADGQPGVITFEAQALAMRDAQAALIVYQQDFKTHVLQDTNEP